MLYVYMETWVQGFSSRVSKLNLIMVNVAALIVSNVATLGVRRVLDVIAGVCSRICHHYVGMFLRGGGAVGVRRRGRRGRRGQHGGGRVAEAQVQGVTEAQGQDVAEAQVQDVESCVVSIDGVVEPSGDVSGTVVNIENEVA